MHLSTIDLSTRRVKLLQELHGCMPGFCYILVEHHEHFQFNAVLSDLILNHS